MKYTLIFCIYGQFNFKARDEQQLGQKNLKVKKNIIILQFSIGMGCACEFKTQAKDQANRPHTSQKNIQKLMCASEPGPNQIKEVFPNSVFPHDKKKKDEKTACIERPLQNNESQIVTIVSKKVKFNKKRECKKVEQVLANEQLTKDTIQIKSMSQQQNKIKYYNQSQIFINLGETTQPKTNPNTQFIQNKQVENQLIDSFIKVHSKDNPFEHLGKLI